MKEALKQGLAGIQAEEVPREGWTRFWSAQLIAIYIVASTLLVLPLVTGSPFVLHLCVMTCVLTILIAGFNIAAGYGGVVSMGHGCFYAVAAYSTIILSTRAGIAVWLAIPLGLLIDGLLAFLIGLATIRVKEFALAILTLAAGWIVFRILWNWESVTGGEPGLIISHLSIGGMKLSPKAFLYVGVALTLFCLISTRNLMSHRFGYAIVAVRDSESAAKSLGVHTLGYKLMAFILSAVFCGIGGILFAYYNRYIDPTMSDVHTSFNFLTMLILGGWATLLGPVIGAAVYIFLPCYLAFLEQYWLFIWAALLLIVLIAAPSGVMGFIAKIPFAGKALMKENLPFPSAIRPEYSTPERAPVFITSRGKDAAALEIKNVTISFGGLQALTDVSLLVEPGTIHSVIGPNGSGKTTLINIITGFYKPDRGEVRYDSKVITGWEPHRIAKLGIVRTFQGVKLFPDLTVGENLMVGRHLQTKGNLFENMFAFARSRKDQDQSLKAVAEALDYFGLRREAYDIAGDLPFGHQRLLEVSRALITEPRLVILDEPAAGLSNAEISDLMKKLSIIRESGLGVLLVEHHVRFVFGISDKVTVLDYGTKIAEGSPKEVTRDEKVIAAYLGKKHGGWANAPLQRKPTPQSESLS